MEPCVENLWLNFDDVIFEGRWLFDWGMRNRNDSNTHENENENDLRIDLQYIPKLKTCEMISEYIHILTDRD